MTIETSTGEITLKEAGALAIESTATEVAVAVGVSPKEPVGEPTEENLRRSLEKVIDPELHMNIVELGLIYKVETVIKEAQTAPDVEVEMTLTSPGCPYGPAIMSKVPLVIKEDFGDAVAEVNVSLTFSPPWDPATMASEDVQFELGIF